MEFKKIDIDTYKGDIPHGTELVVAEEGNEIESALVLLGFDEIGYFDREFKNPVYGFLSEELS